MTIDYDIKVLYDKVNCNYLVTKNDGSKYKITSDERMVKIVNNYVVQGKLIVTELGDKAKEWFDLYEKGGLL